MSARGQDAPDYERVRSELAERGYLGGRVERFVLQGWPRVEAGSRPRLARSALKAASLGAPVLALLLAATVARDHGPLIAARDFPLLWLYFTPLCALGLLLLNSTVGWLSGRWTQRFGVRGGEVTRAALLAGLPTLAYLLFLGRQGRAPRGFPAEAGFFALGVGVVVFVSWLAGLVSVAGILGRTGEVAGRRWRSLKTLFVVVPLAMLALTVVRLAGAAAPPGEPWPPFEPAAAERLLFVGVDGIDGEWIAALEPGGAVDGLLELMASGTVIPLHREAGGEPPGVWMSIMTGMRADVHGLQTAAAERFPGVATPLRPSGRLPLVAALRLLLPSTTVPASGVLRRVRTVWEIVGHQRRALAVGWWGSWPATGEDGIHAPWIVSDRVLPKLLAGAPFDRDTWPDELYARLSAGFAERVKRWRAELDTAFAGQPASVVELAWESFLIDAFHVEALRVFWDDARVESGFVYLPGLEILRHRAAAPGAGLTTLQRAAAFESYTRRLDRWIGALLDLAGESVTIVLVADPGRGGASGAEGFAVVRGGAAPAGCVEGPADSRAVTPLVLAASGLPVSLEMPAVGKLACLGAIVERAGTVASYGRRRIRARDVASAYDEEMVERLRSLGYLN